MSIKRASKPTHVTKGSVFGDLGFSSEEAAVLRLKTTLHLEYSITTNALRFGTVV